ncbi:MAG TPA: DoxX family protein [Thermoanaerobaculia bacterium]|jgi:putative oxidoreductase|nr:DoxX family protein [Thermoanaerobaculia bacterium]
MLKKLMQTDDDVGRLIVRLALGIVMFPHGAQKLLGWFGGGGFAGTMQGMTSMGLPAVIVFLVILFEFFGSLSLLSGFLGRVGAFGILCVMLGALFTVHLSNGFFMNWMGNQKGEGFEYHLLAIGMALAVIVKGSGAFSIDRSMSDKGTYYRR